MREILFKAKRKDNGEWVEGLLWKKKYITNKIFISCFPDKDDNEEVYVVDANTICQYTGLTDKNGNKIWENDVLKSGLVVTWEKEFASFCLSRKGWAFRHFFGEAVNGCDCEVIGNIFDSPELLKGSEEND